MKSLLASICFIFTQVVAAQTVCIPHIFAAEDIEASYQRVNEEKIAELAAVQKDYADFFEQVRSKKSRDNKIELTNAFVDASAAAFIIHKGVSMFKMATITKIIASGSQGGEELFELEDIISDNNEDFRGKMRKFVQGLGDDQKADLRKRLGKKYEDKVVKTFEGPKQLLAAVEKFADDTEDGGFGKTVKDTIKGWFNVPERFKKWLDSLKDMPFGQKLKKIVTTSAGKVGFASMLLAAPLAIYINIAKISEQQRLVHLTAAQDKVMKQALVLELFLHQKSFTELAATRALMHPKAVCPPTT